MKLAASIRYGGELVAAHEVDYEAYRHLGLICPHCSDPVFLAAAHQRHLAKGAVADISAQFRHFKASDPVLVQRCIARVAQYDEKEIQRRASVARQQRLKLLQRWFWTIFADRSEGMQVFIEDPEAQEVRNLCKHFVPRTRDFFVKACEDSSNIDRALGFLLEPFDHDPCITDERLKHDLTRLTQLDLRLHSAICKEVVKFVLSRANAHMFDQILLAAIGLSFCGEISRKRLEQGGDVARIVYTRLLGLLVVIPWADEFELIEQRSKNPLHAVRV